MKTILLLLVVACISVVFYFSWLPSPNLDQETYLPNWLLNWSNIYYNLRTAVPFVAIGFLLEEAKLDKIMRGSYASSLRVFMQNTAISAAVVCVAEGGQFVLQNRNPDLMDVFFGTAGSIMGSMVYYLLHYFINIKRIIDAK